MSDDEDFDIDMYFGDEGSSKKFNSNNVIMPYYSQVDAVIGTFPREGNNGKCHNSSKYYLLELE